MGRLNQPASYFGGGFRVDGDLVLDGDLRFSPVRIGERASGLKDTLVIGVDGEASGENSTAVGNESRASNQNTAAFGEGAIADGVDATALGKETLAPNNWNTVVGYQAGSVNNGANVVLIGRKSEGEGADVVAIGENAAANGNQSTVVGKATIATSENASAFGQGSTVEGKDTTVVGQGLSISNDSATAVGTGISVDGIGATAVGKGSIADGDNSVAIGRDAEANGEDAIAIGSGSIVNRDQSYGFGDRDLGLNDGRSILFPNDSGVQVLSDIPINGEATEGTEQAIDIAIGGTTLFKVGAEADGSGDIQNSIVQALTDLVVEGDVNEVSEILTGNIEVENGSGAAQIVLDASSSPQKIDFGNIPIRNFILRDGDAIKLEDDPGVQTLADFGVTTGAAVDSEQSYTLDIDGSSFLKLYSEADGDGGIQNPDLRLLEQFNVNGNSIIDESADTTVWDAGNEYIPTSSLQDSSVSITTGDNLSGGGSVSLGESVDIDIGDELSIDVISDGGSEAIDFDVDGERRANLDNNGDLSIEGELNEGATL